MANTYTIESLLVGKEYRSNSIRSGSIISAEKSDNWFGREYQAYLVQVRPDNSLNETYRIVAVKTEDN